MSSIHAYLFFFILVVSIFNLLRIGLNLVANELFDLTKNVRHKDNCYITKDYQPIISIVIPAFNEEKSIVRTLQYVLANTYAKMDIIVVDDGSTDDTSKNVAAYLQRTGKKVKLVKQSNGGKSVAINNAVKNYARGELVMVLDADSQLAADAVTNMVRQFSDSRVLALAANVKMLKMNTVLGIAQRFEFVSAYRGKCSEDLLKTLYIIGGIGSTFRRNAMLAVGMYDTDTVTEDIDFTMKLIQTYGNKYYRIGYASDVVVHTEPVRKFRSLLKQRFRWKYGRFKAFIKYRRLFFSRDPKLSKLLSWYTLPYAMAQEFFMFIEPLLFLYIQYMIIRYLDWHSFGRIMLFFAVIILLAFVTDKHETPLERVKLFVKIPLAYFFMFSLTIVDFCSLLKSTRKVMDLVRNKEQHANWEHVERM